MADNDNDETIHQATVAHGSPEGGTNEDGRQLLSLLGRDFAKENKQSAKQCVRSKTLPCPEVSKILEQATALLHPRHLRKAYQVLLQHDDYLGPGSLLRSSSCTSADISSKTSLWHMSRVATVIRFLQLLFEWKRHRSRIVQMAAMDENEVTTMILGLLQTLSSTIADAMNRWKSSDFSRNPQDNALDSADNDDDDQTCIYSGDATTLYEVPKVACFAYAFLSRLKPYVIDVRPDMLPTLWKSLDQIASSMMILPVELVTESVKSLCGYLNEFYQQSLAAAVQLQQTMDSNNDAAIPPTTLKTMQQQQRLCSFLLSRLATFLKLGSGSLDQTLVEDACGILFRLSGLSNAAVAMFMVSLQQPMEQGTVIAEIYAKGLDPCTKIATKAEKCLLSLLVGHETTKGVGTDKELSLNIANLDRLLDLGVPKKMSASVLTCAEKETGSQISRDAFAAGKVKCLLKVLDESMPQKTQQQSTVIPRVLRGEDSVRCLLSIAEHLLFKGLPQCHGILVSSAPVIFDQSGLLSTLTSGVIARTITNILSVFYNCETLAPSITSNARGGKARFHRLLVRWVLVASQTSSHPLTRELVLTISQLHTLRLCMKPPLESCADRDGGVSSMPLFELLVGLFFDPRAPLSCRATIRSLFLRSLTSYRSFLAKTLKALLVDGYAKVRLRKRKRKRSGKALKTENRSCWSSYTIEDVQIISSLLPRLKAKSIPNLDVDLETFCSDLKKKSDALGGGTRQRSRRRLSTDSLKTSMVALGLLGAVIKSSRNATDSTVAIPSVVVGMDIYTLQQLITYWFLCHWDAEFVNGSRKPADVSQVSNIALLGANVCQFSLLCTEDSRFLRHEQLKALFQLIDACTDQNRVVITSGRNAVGLTRSSALVAIISEAMDVLGKAGHLLNIVPADDPDKSFQSLADIFHRVFSGNDCWTLSKQAISALYMLSRTPNIQKPEMLTRCFPVQKQRKKDLKRILTKRLQGDTSRSKQKPDETNRSGGYLFPTLQYYCSNRLESAFPEAGARLVPTRLRLFQSWRSLCLKSGSFILTLPTQEGRSALVVFPPGTESRQDIEYMLGEGDETLVEQLQIECTLRLAVS